MAISRVGIYPGTFDPITSGHCDIVRRALRLVDKLVIGVASNTTKGPLFSVEDRIEMAKNDLAQYDPQGQRIEVRKFDILSLLSTAFWLVLINSLILSPSSVHAHPK